MTRKVKNILRNNLKRTGRILIKIWQQFGNLETNVDHDSSKSNHELNVTEVNESEENIVKLIRHNLKGEFDNWHFEKF